MGLRVLITNTALSGRTGTEIFVVQLADKLRSHGHDVILYSPQVGETGLALRKRGHLVFDRIADVSQQPDVIHGHHVGPLLAAIVAFPQTPAIQILHSVESEFDAPIVHPQVVSHFAVSEYVRTQRATQRLPADAIGILKNAVDLDAYPFRERTAPTAALSIAKLSGGAQALQRACDARDISLVLLGSSANRVVDDLDQHLDGADIVFASGRSALEAMACGCAVVLTDGYQFGGLVTAATLDRLLDLNLGIRSMPLRVSQRAVADAIHRLDWADVAAVSRRVREVASLDGQVRHLLAIYRAAIAARPDLSTVHRATADLVERYVLTHGDRPWIRLAHDVATGFFQNDLANVGHRHRLPSVDPPEPNVRMSAGDYSFRIDEGGVSWLQSGWWPAEQWGTWSKGSAVLVAGIEAYITTIALRYRIYNSGARATLEIGGTALRLQLDIQPADREGVRTIAFRVPAESIDAGYLELRFDVDQMLSPAEGGGLSSDHRKLGLGIVGLEAS